MTVLSAISGGVIANFSDGIIGSRFGTAVTVLPDRDLDGRCEFLVSAPAATTSGPSFGAVHVISSATGLALASHFGSASGFFLGSILDVVGDVNGDGVVDYAFSSIDLSLSTLISVHSGATDSLLYQLPGPNISSVKPLGDINNDGFDDFVTSAPSYPLGASPVGRVVVHSGFDGSVLHSRSGASGAPSGSRAGNIIGTAGDYNGDGTPDYIFSTDGGPTSTINVASGATHQVIGGLRTVTAIGSTQPTVGGFVTATPDFNGDGVPDYLLGLPIAGSSVGECVLIFDKTPYTETYSSSNSALPEALSLAHVQTVTPSGGIGGPSTVVEKIVCSFATPGALGLAAASFSPGDLSYGNLPILISFDVPNLAVVGTIGATAAGQFVVDNVDMRSPIMGGKSLYVQFFETSPIFKASNGLRLSFR